MNPDQTDPALQSLLDSFAARWLALSDPRVAAEIVADPILILGPAGKFDDRRFLLEANSLITILHDRRTFGWPGALFSFTQRKIRTSGLFRRFGATFRKSVAALRLKPFALPHILDTISKGSQSCVSDLG